MHDRKYGVSGVFCSTRPKIMGKAFESRGLWRRDSGRMVPMMASSARSRSAARENCREVLLDVHRLRHRQAVGPVACLRC